MNILVILKDEDPADMQVRSCHQELQGIIIIIMCIHIFQRALDCLMKLIPVKMLNEVSYITCAIKRNKVQSL